MTDSNVPNVPKKSRLDGNTIPVSPAKHWCFTLNNYSKDDIIDLKTTDCSKVPIIGFQEEKGKNGTPHLQGYLCFDTKRRPFEVFKNKKIHWEVCRNIPASRNYIQKEDSKNGERFLRGIKPIEKYEISMSFNTWQQEILDILEEKPDFRNILWYWEPVGNTGKTLFTKWLILNKKDVIVLSGKGTDMKHAIVQYYENKKRYPKIIIVDVPRTNNKYISYCGLEEIKNMCFFSGKYEGGMICGPNPHLIIFSNSEPEYEKMSSDRWVVRKI